MARHGAYILGPSGPQLEAEEAAFYREAAPWGFILFDRNIEAPDQLRRLTASLREAVGWHAPILIDQEGGRVQRMWPPDWRQWEPALDMVRRARNPENAMYLRGRLIAAELLGCGIDVNCTPLGDIAGADTHPRLRNRCYGSDAETVARLARKLADGQAAGGVLSVLKHIPGHGRSTLDSHHDLPVVRESRAVLEASDFQPFKALADLPLGMTAHLIYAAFDASLPATISPRMHEVIRDVIGFEGLLMTDDLSMEALSGTVAERSRAAISAGCDVILHCNGALDEMRAVAEAAGRMTDAAHLRAEAAANARTAPDQIDIAALEADLSAEMMA